MKLFARPRNELRRAAVARTASAVPPARRNGVLAAARPADWSAARIWLPELLEDRVAELIKRRRSGRSALIRETLSICVYGAYRFEQMREQPQRLFWRKAIPEFHSKSGGRELDESADDCKVWLPQKLKADLSTLAQAAGMTYPNYVRAILILHFMGRQSTPERDAAMQAIEQPENEEVSKGGKYKTRKAD